MLNRRLTITHPLLSLDSRNDSRKAREATRWHDVPCVHDGRGDEYQNSRRTERKRAKPPATMDGNDDFERCDDDNDDNAMCENQAKPTQGCSDTG